MTIDKLLSDICYHEAGHFVIGEMVHQIKELGFDSSESVTINIKFGEKYLNHVRGFRPYHNQETADIFFEELKEQKIKAEILILLAGFVSYCVYVDDTKNFIKDPFIDNDEGILTKKNYEYYYQDSIYDIYKRPPPIGHDFYEIGKILHHNYPMDDNRKLKFIQSLVDELKKIFLLDGVRKAVAITYEIFKEENGNVIKVDELDSLKDLIYHFLQPHILNFEKTIYGLNP